MLGPGNQTCYIRQTLMYHHPNYYKKLRAQALKQPTSSREGGPESRQAQPQVVLKKKIIDKGSKIGYSGIITDGKARHAQLNASPSRIPGISGRQTHSKTDVSLLQEQSGRRHLPGIVFPTSSQAPVRKPASPEPGAQASSPNDSVPEPGNQGTSESSQASGNRQQE